MQSMTKLACLALSAILLAGCSTFFSSIGPSRRDIDHSADARSLPPIKIVDVDAEVTERLLAQRTRHLFSEVLTSRPDQLQVIGAGDFLVVSIWEATPATLFGNTQINPTGLSTPSLATTLPEQPVDGEGASLCRSPAGYPRPARRYPTLRPR
jgi:polysaccharide biosynthesis/export protein